MTDKQEEAAAALAEHGSIRRAAAALGVPASTLQNRLDRRRAARGEVGGPPIPEIARPPVGFAVSHNAGAYDVDGKLLRQWVGTRRDSGEEYAVPSGHVVKGESALVDPDGRVLAKWIKTKEGAGDGLVEGLREAFAAYDGAARPIAAPHFADDDLLTVYPLPDLHFGLYSWRPESGCDYDIKIAAEVAEQAMHDLVAQSRSSRYAVLLGLGDLFHSNDHKEVTPAHGHKLDVDGRWPKVFAEGAKLTTRLVDAVARKHPETEIVFLKGNHDPDSSVALSVALSLFYSQTPHIKVTENANVVWWRRHGRCLLAATHGHTMKPADLMQVTASDRASDWGQTQFRHGYMGHIHHERAVEIAGMRIESFQAVTARDAHTAEHGYRSGRSLSAVLFHAERGEIGRHRVNISGV